MNNKLLIAITLTITATTAFGHGTAPGPDGASDTRKIEFPDTAEFQTLVLDPHTHSVFSDGHVWPRIRIGEAFRDGLDAIAITEHLEYQPHLADIPHPDRNRSYEEAVLAAGDSDLIVIPGSEITREAPVGHMNAIFIKDANALMEIKSESDPADVEAHYIQAGEWPAQQAVQAANDQDAFVFWNHPYWARDFSDGIPDIPEFHMDNARKGLLHGIEIANGADYSEETFQIALDHDLTLMGVSDIHNLIAWDYKPHEGGHRPVTLVFARERTSDSIKEALFAGRTVVWFRNMLIGRPAQLNPLLDASLTVDSARYFDDTEILVMSVTNVSDTDFQLMNKSEFTFYRNADLIEVPAHETIDLGVKTGKKVDSVQLDFDVLNALTAPKTPASIMLSAEVQQN